MERAVLTPKQEAFATAYAASGCASEAYRRAYHVRPTTRPSTVWNSASELLAHPGVARRIEELQAQHRERHAVTIDRLTEQLDEALTIAIAKGQPSAAIQAIMAKAKLHGLIVDRAAVEARNYVVSDTPEGQVVENKPHVPMTVEEWERTYGDR